MRIKASPRAGQVAPSLRGSPEKGPGLDWPFPAETEGEREAAGPGHTRLPAQPASSRLLMAMTYLCNSLSLHPGAKQERARGDLSSKGEREGPPSGPQRAARDRGRGPGLRVCAGPEDLNPRGPHITPFVLSPRISQREQSL